MVWQEVTAVLLAQRAVSQVASPRVLTPTHSNT